MAITVEARSDLVSIVVGMFNAAPGAAILSDLTVAFEAGQTRLQIATNLAKSAEYLLVFPEFLTNGEFATKLVNNMLGNLVGAAGKAEAVALLTAKLNAANTSTPATKAAARADTSIYALDLLKAVPVTDATFGAAAQALANKVEVATYYSVVAQDNPTSVQQAQEVIENVTNTAASVTAAKNAIDNVSNEGTTYTLTVGADAVTGTSADDVFNALSINAQGAAASTLTAFDNLDGGNGKDTLNIYTTGAENAVFPTNTTVKNIEIINVFNSGAAAALADASKYTGVQQLWQHGAATTVTNLGSATTAGFKNIAGGPALAVTPTAAAESVSVALDAVAGASTLTVNAGTALKAVNISGALSTGGTLATTANVGAAQTSLALNTAIATTLTTAGAALVNVDASASTAAITYAAGTAIRSIKTGAANDTVTTTTTTSGTASAVVDTGAGNDTITVATTGSGTTTVEAGAGNDTINLNTVGTGKTTINAGAGDDVVVIGLAGGIDAIKTTDVIDGGEGTDTLSFAGKVFDAEDYIILTEVVKNFETLRVTTSAADIDASKLASFTTFANQIAGTTLTKVAAGQAVTTTTSVTVSANGYAAKATGPTAQTNNSGTLVGTLNITSLAATTVTASGEIANLTVSPAVSNNTGTVDTISTTLTGDLKTANVTLVAKTDTNGTTTTTADDVLEVSNIIITTADNSKTTLDGLTSITVSGNGTATITNGAYTALTTVDVSGLASKDIAGTATAGLTYVTKNAAIAETITLGAGLDNLTITGSQFSKMDTITGLTLVDDAAVAGLQVDTAKSDDITVRSNDDSLVLTGFVKTTTTAASLNLALVDMAASAAGDKLVFQFGGDTYIFADVDVDGTAGDNILNDSDILIKLTGTVDLDLLISALNA